MAYPNISSKILQDINSRKEFIQFLVDNDGKENTKLDNEIQINKNLMLNNYQQFINNFMSYNTKFNRLLLVHSTGVGKTISSLSTSLKFLKETNVDIYILGFSKSVFKKELLSRPEFGIVTKKEINEMRELRDRIMKLNNKRDKLKYVELRKRYSGRLKRAQNKIIFLGYKMITNRLFIKTNQDINIEEITTIDSLNLYIKKGYIKINLEFLNQINNSFIICDEIHNLYNSNNINNWGFALKYILDNTTTKVLMLSATPVNNKPYKIVSVINLLNEGEVKTEELFKDTELTDEGKKIIIKKLTGKVSYLMDSNPELYPTKEFKGEDIPGIDYLKFIKCPMSNLHFKTYMNQIAKKDILVEESKDLDDIEEENYILNMLDTISPDKKYSISLESDNRYLNDMVIPSFENKDIGLFTKSDIIKSVTNSTAIWRKEYGIELEKLDKNYKNTVIGDILLESNIKKYSTKYYNLLKVIKEQVISNKGKIFIYHNFVQVSGVLFLNKLFKQNGFIELGEGIDNDTRCSKCYKQNKSHNDTHEFIPLTFITLSGLTNKSEMDNNIDLFNNDENKDGNLIKIILGSRIIKESYDLKAVRNVIVTHQPENISTLIQILGRAIRKGSHLMVEPEKRHVEIFMLVSSMPDYVQKKSKNYIYTYEESKYIYKINTYKKIQNINKLFLENSIDLSINYNINYPAGYTYNSNDLFSIEKFSHKSKIDYNKLVNTTFGTYYYQDEIAYCKYIIKRLFIEQSKVWDYNTLFEAVKNPYFKTNRNTSIVSEESFIVALDYLTYKVNNLNMVNEHVIESYIDKLIDDTEKFIYIYQKRYTIVYHNSYYILTEYINNKTAVEYESFTRDDSQNSLTIDINNFINDNILDDYTVIREYFINKFINYKIEDLDIVLFEYDSDFHINFIEETINYISLVLVKHKPKSSYHDFYIKMLYFYNKFNIILFANKLDKETNKIYEKYIIKTNNKTYTSSDSNYKDIEDEYNYNNLISSIEDEYDYTMNSAKLQYYVYYKIVDIYNDTIKKKSKAYDYILPIGHIFDKTIKILNCDTNNWETKVNYNKIRNKFIDNKQIIGYLEKDKTGFDLSFKIKLNNKESERLDKRTIKTGVTCHHIEKQALEKVCKDLDIDISKIKKRKISICNLIKIKLIKLELKERKKKNSNIRYFYFYWE